MAIMWLVERMNINQVLWVHNNNDREWWWKSSKIKWCDGADNGGCWRRKRWGSWAGLMKWESIENKMEGHVGEIRRVDKVFKVFALFFPSLLLGWDWKWAKLRGYLDQSLYFNIFIFFFQYFLNFFMTYQKTKTQI